MIGELKMTGTVESSCISVDQLRLAADVQLAWKQVILPLWLELLEDLPLGVVADDPRGHEAG